MSNKPIEIVIEDVFDKALELAEACPDFKYVSTADNYGTNCRYTRGGCDTYPQLIGCIVGQAIVQAAGIDKRDAVHTWLQEVDSQSPAGITTLIEAAIDKRRNCQVTFVAKRYADKRHSSAYVVRKAIAGLGIMQRVQDHNRTWAEAVKEVKQYVDEDCHSNVRCVADKVINNLYPEHA